MATPRVVEQVGTGVGDRARDLGPPGVDADDECRVPFPYQGDEIGNTLRISSAVSTSGPGRP